MYSLINVSAEAREVWKKIRDANQTPILLAGKTRNGSGQRLKRRIINSFVSRSCFPCNKDKTWKGLEEKQNIRFHSEGINEKN